MGVCQKPFVSLVWFCLFTFPRVLCTFLHAPPWFSKSSVAISYAPIRSEQPCCNCKIHVLKSRVPIRSVQQSRKKYSLAYVPVRSVQPSGICGVKTYTSKSYVPNRSEQPSRISRLICYVPSRFDYVSSGSTEECNNFSSCLRSFTFRLMVS